MYSGRRFSIPKSDRQQKPLRALHTFGRRRSSMKATAIAMGLWIMPALLTLADSPIPFHPPAPPITATKAIEIAAQFTGATTNAARYCSSVKFDEGGMGPAPRGSVRHWVVMFQTAGANRAELRLVYVDMDGHASDTVPASSLSDLTSHGSTGRPAAGCGLQFALVSASSPVENACAVFLPRRVVRRVDRARCFVALAASAYDGS